MRLFKKSFAKWHLLGGNLGPYHTVPLFCPTSPASSTSIPSRVTNYGMPEMKFSLYWLFKNYLGWLFKSHFVKGGGMFRNHKFSYCLHSFLYTDVLSRQRKMPLIKFTFNQPFQKKVIFSLLSTDNTSGNIRVEGAEFGNFEF